MGKAEKVSRHTVVLAVAGREERIWERRLSTYSSDWIMSTRQLKKTLISAEPRPVVERTVMEPGISFIASSIGLVMVAIISSAGITPLSTRMTTRGKFVCGKTEDGTWNAALTPARHSATLIKAMASLWRMANWPRATVRVMAACKAGSQGRQPQTWRPGKGDWDAGSLANFPPAHVPWWFREFAFI